MRGHRASYDDALHYLIENGSVPTKGAIMESDDVVARMRADDIERHAACDATELAAHLWRKPVWMVVMDARRLRIKRAA